MTEAIRPGDDMIQYDTQSRPVPVSGLRGTAVLCITEDTAWVDAWLRPALQTAGARVEVVPVEEASLTAPHGCRLVLLDLGAQEERGFGYCARLRQATHLPLMLVLHGTARDSAVSGYEAGADACVSLPCDPRELLARAGALVRRHDTWPEAA
jgi:two-component system KDP operon response regulator KdpE